MNSEQIYEKLKLLKANETTDDEFDVIEIEGYDHKIGVSKEKYPKVFLCTRDEASSIPNQTLELLTVEYNTPCTFVDDSGSMKQNYTIITLLSQEDYLQREFIDIIAMIIEKLKPLPSKSEIADEVEYLISIFSAMQAAPKKKIQGLWAELLVIDRCSDPDVLVQSWHSEPSSKYDFTMGRDKIEVKSTSSEERKHRMVLDQLNPTPNSRLLIASTMVRESGHGDDGLSVYELRDKVAERIKSAEGKAHLFIVIAKTLGTAYAKARDIYFDYVEASDSLKFFDYHKVPKIAKEHVGKGVSEVKFLSDFTEVPDIISEQYPINDSPLFKCLF